MKKNFLAGVGLLFCALAGGAADDPVEEYRQECEEPLHAAYSAMTYPGSPSFERWDSTSCEAFVKRLEATGTPDALTRLALFLGKLWLGSGDYPNDVARCAEVAEILDSLPDNADALYEWYYCTDAGDADSLKLLTRLAETGTPAMRASRLKWFMHTGDYDGTPPETLVRIAEGLYENARYVDDTFLAAQVIYKVASAAGDLDTAEAIQRRFVHDHGLDSLDFGPAHRGESLALACDNQMFGMDLEQRLCVPALEAFAAAALASGEAIPPEVVLRLAEALKAAEFKARRTGGEDLVGERLAALLAAHPEPLRSGEHLRALANTTTPFGSPERAAALRKAVDIDPNNLRARCDLAEALGLTGAVAEAVSLYKELMMAAEHPPCSAEFAIKRLADRQEGKPYDVELIEL